MCFSRVHGDNLEKQLDELGLFLLLSFSVLRDNMLCNSIKVSLQFAMSDSQGYRESACHAAMVVPPPTKGENSHLLLSSSGGHVEIVR